MAKPPGAGETPAMQELRGKVAVVTGAASGIGLAMSERLVDEGMKVVMADIEEPALGAAAAQLRDRGGDVLDVVTDVSRGEAVEALAERALAAYRVVHLVHNNAGVAAGGPMWELSTRDWEWVLGVNLWGVIHGVRVFVPLIIEAGGGHVVNTASMAGVMSGPLSGPYNVSKHGVVTLSETLYKELQMLSHPIGVSVLCPGWVNTNIGDSDRNRPAELVSDRDPLADDIAEGRRAMMSAFLQSGLSPAEVAGMVVEAVKADRFYVFTHPWQEMIESRMRDMIEGRNPTPVAPPV
jgi:NAD(P)-dependent dehydrogenase (short-subunit alcohol dehydrogenase family)